MTPSATQVLDRRPGGPARRRCRAARAGTSGCSAVKPLHVHLVDRPCRATGRARRAVAAPVERRRRRRPQRGTYGARVAARRRTAPSHGPSRRWPSTAGSQRDARRRRPGRTGRAAAWRGCSRGPAAGPTGRARGSRSAGRGRCRPTRPCQTSWVRLGQPVPVLGAVVVEQAQLDGVRAGRPQREVGARAVPVRAERGGRAGEDLDGRGCGHRAIVPVPAWTSCRERVRGGVGWVRVELSLLGRGRRTG